MIEQSETFRDFIDALRRSIRTAERAVVDARQPKLPATGELHRTRRHAERIILAADCPAN